MTIYLHRRPILVQAISLFCFCLLNGVPHITYGQTSNPKANATLVSASNAKRAAALLARAQTEFKEGKFDKAIKSYRQCLRLNRGNGDIWSQLGVAYFYAGEWEKAETILSKWEPATKIKSYNFYHRGLVLVALNRFDEARAPLTRAAAFVDEYGSRAIYELATLDYIAGDDVRTRYWINLYRQRFPNGAAITLINKMDQALTSGKKDGAAFTGNKKPNRQSALFRYHPYSLHNTPHFWFSKFGYRYAMGESIQPSSSDKSTRANPFIDNNLIIHLGLGLGPIQQDQVRTHFGYSYRQDWYTDQERLESYFDIDEATDLLVYLPFRADLLERTHRVFGDLELSLPQNFYTGIYVYQEYSFLGSTLIPSPGGDEIEQRSKNISNANLIKPFVGYRYKDRFDGVFYLYMYKKLSEDAQEYSHKTYNFTNGDPLVSYGLNGKFNFPEYRFRLDLDLFLLEYMYNDYWLDYTRLGGVLAAEFDFDYGFKGNAAFGFYQDQYQIPVPRVGSCDYKNSKKEETGSEIKQCTHQDVGMVFQAGIEYKISNFSNLAFNYTMIDNQSPQLIIYQRNENIFKFEINMYFPDNDRMKFYTDEKKNFIYHKNVE